MPSDAEFYELSKLNEERKRGGKRYLEFLRVPAMSAGIYVLAAGAEDPQKPHGEDEMYYIARGKARMRVGDQEREVAAGDVIFVAAHVEHRFNAIEEELVVLVFFAPAESS
jgi:quercetin dioxygenase-like cupin family protein